MAVPQLQAVWAKLNANERLVSYGAFIVIIAGLLGAATGGLSYGFLTGIIVLVIYWLKYGGSNINWPAPVATIVLVITAIAALFALLLLFGLLSLFAFYGGIYAISGLASVVGTGIMAWGAWKEYQSGAKMPAPPAPPAA
jgi:hypothetical protein